MILFNDIDLVTLLGKLPSVLAVDQTCALYTAHGTLRFGVDELGAGLWVFDPEGEKFCEFPVRAELAAALIQTF